MTKKAILKGSNVMKRISAIILATFILLVCSSCGSVTNTIENNNKIEDVKLEHIVTTCNEVQAHTKISVVDGTLYCMWVDVAYNDEGRDFETYVLDAFENGSWKNIYKQENEFEGSPYFEKTYEYPLCERVGDKIIYTDPDNNFYLLDTLNGKIYDLEMNLGEWRAFATDNENVFAVLSASTNGYGKSEIRIYDISKNEK